jgi:lipoprotein-anchoring transpeptidase ErfK/SrfK
VAVVARRGRKAGLAALGALIVAAAFFSAVYEWSGATLAGDPVALARVNVETFAGRVQSTRAVGQDGRAIPLTVAGGRLTPRERIAPGARVTVEVTLKRPGWDAWLLGDTRTERLTVRAPVAHVRSRWVTARAGSPVTVGFGSSVARVRYGSHTVTGTRDAVSIPASAPAGTVRIRLAARSWESLGRPARVRWFPRTARPVALVSPAPDGKLSPAGPLRLTFAQRVRDVLGDAHPKLSPAVPGHWRRPNSHTLEFVPSGLGVPLGAHEKLTFRHSVALADPDGRHVATTREATWTVPEASTLRLNQLLADAGYLPVKWTPSGDPVARTERAQAGAAALPPDGHFSWRYANTPPELKSQWDAKTATVVTKGALMMYQDEHHMTVDGIAGPDVWKSLMQDAIKGTKPHAGYSYVYVHENVPQKMTLWHDGQVVITSPGNTGIASAPTALGTFPVFEHLRVTTMSGTNPDGSHYNDPGIQYVSYFNGGDALHAFPRASFGTPQSLGCVELPLAAAAKVWPYTPIGTLVTIED